MNGWQPRWFPSGLALVSGAGSIWHWQLGREPVQLLPWGHEPVPMDETTFLFHDGGAKQGTFRYDLTTNRITVLTPVELVELAGGGGRWAGVEPGKGLWRSHESFVPGAGQPFIAQNGLIIYRVGDDKIEPSICRSAAAWGDGHGGILGWTQTPAPGRITVAGPEYRPRVVDTPHGPWVLTMTHTTLRLRQFGAPVGYTRHTGDNQNLHADVVYRNGEIHVVYQNDRGTLFLWSQSLAEAMSAFAPDSGTPAPIPGPIPTPPMPTPNRLDVVRAEFARQRPLPNSTESCGEFTRRVARRLHDEDQSWGMLTKTAGEAQYAGFAVDAIIYRPTQQVIDIISGAEGPNPQPAWQEVPKRDINHWAPPPAGDDTDPGDETPAPQPGVDLSGLIRRLDEQDVKIAKLEQALRKKVALKSVHGRYVCAEPSGLVVADREVRGGWEEFEVERV